VETGRGRSTDLAGDVLGPLEAMATTRAIRRFRHEPVPDDVLSTILFAATRAPSGSNRQAFRFVVLRDGERARRAKAILGEAARLMWNVKRNRDGYDAHAERAPASPKARMARTMYEFVERFEDTPVVILACSERHRPGPEETIGASIYPACQNLLLAARTLGYGGVMTTWHGLCDGDLREALDIPPEVFIAATIPLGRPVGGHGPVRRRPLEEVVFDDRWGAPASWVSEPEGTRHTRGGPPG
jgi:nitroreductase